ncbi:MAG: glycosyltransferase family 2 protein [bacterium]
MNKIFIIIVNWNTGELLARCLRSLQSLPEREKIDEVIVVDNASTDRSLVKAQVVVGKSINRPRVRFIKQTSNVGFARANNMAIELVANRLDQGGHVLLLNPDTEVKSGVLTGMLRVLEQDNKVGVVGPRLLNSDGSSQNSVRAFPTFWVFVFLLLKLHRLLPGARLWRRYKRDNFDYLKQAEVDQVKGAAFMIRGEVVRSMGVLDEKFWVWFEEVDYCKRVKEAGWKVVYTPEAQVIHHGAVSFNQLAGFQRSLLWLRSCLHYAGKYLLWYEQVILWLLAPISVLLIIPTMFWRVKKKNCE